MLALGDEAQRRDVQVGKALVAVPRRAEIDAIFVDRCRFVADLFDQRDQRAAERHEILERMTAQHLQSGFEEGFGRNIRLDDMAVRRNGHDRMGQRIQDRALQRGTIGQGLRIGGRHGATPCSDLFKKEPPA